MTTRTWSREEIVAFASLHGVKLETDAEIERMAALGTRVASVAGSVKRMPSKGNEPASVFKVPL
jgi:hypothetical protein